MNYFSIDALIVYGFLLITLVTGLWAGRNVKTIQEYAIANRVYGTGVLVMAFLSTYIECWNLVGFPGDIFADGITHLIPSVLFGVIFCLLFIAKFIAPKMIYFQGCLTMGELMGRFYGKYGRIATGFLGLVYNITAVSIQIIFFKIVCTLLGINGNWGVAISAFILVLYASFGGIKSVTITGVVQFIVITVALSVMLNMVLDQVGGFKQLFTKLPVEKLQLFKFDKEKAGEFGAGYYSFPILAIWFLFPGFPLSFPFVQRMLMAKDNRQLITMYYWGTAFLVVFFLVLTFIGLGMVVLYPKLESGQVIPYLIQMFPASWLRGIALIGLIAVIMSTADAFLHSAGLLFVHDVIKPIADKQGIEINELRVVRYFTLLIGCISIAVSLMAKNIFSIAVYGMDLSALIFTIPLIAGIMGLKTDARSFTTILSFFFAKFFLPNLFFIPFAILMNALSFFGAHYMQNKGFVTVKRTIKVLD
jgi:solute:Na+ symporter, SSS family